LRIDPVPRPSWTVAFSGLTRWRSLRGDDSAGQGAPAGRRARRSWRVLDAGPRVPDAPL